MQTIFQTSKTPDMKIDGPAKSRYVCVLITHRILVEDKENYF